MTNFVITITTENEEDADAIKELVEEALEEGILMDPVDIHTKEEED